MHDFRLLGLAIRARWLGFAELDAQRRLIDWGMVFYQKRTPGQFKSAKKKLDDLLARMGPSFVVLVLPGLKADGGVPAVRSIVRSLRATASTRSIQIIPLHRSAIRGAFAPRKARKTPKCRSSTRSRALSPTINAVSNLPVIRNIQVPIESSGRPPVTYRRMIRPPRLEGPTRGRNRRSIATCGPVSHRVHGLRVPPSAPCLSSIPCKVANLESTWG
jgi:hypothetical protein